MPKFMNVSPLGALDLPLLGRVVAAGEVIEVTAAQAKHLDGQDAVWRPVKSRGPKEPDPGPAVPETGGEQGESTTGEGEDA